MTNPGSAGISAREAYPAKGQVIDRPGAHPAKGQVIGGPEAYPAKGQVVGRPEAYPAKGQVIGRPEAHPAKGQVIGRLAPPLVRDRGRASIFQADKVARDPGATHGRPSCEF